MRCPITGGALLVVIFTFPFPNICSAREHVINVNAINGSDTESCLEGITPCATINMALNGSSFIGNTTLTLRISPGNYTLEYGDFNNITGSGSVAIIGRGALETIVECDPGAGLYMSSLHEITIQSITLVSCSYKNQLSITVGYNPQIVMNASSAALTFVSCQTVFVCNVTILNSYGSGVLLIKSGPASIVGCLIRLGHYLESFSGSLAVGGIVHLNFDNQSLFVMHSSITNNNYLVNETSHCEDIKATGAIVAVGALHLDIDIDSCLIANNSRGIYLFHFNCACSYKINNTIISDNQNASMLTVYKNSSSYHTQLNLTILGVKLTESALFMISIPQLPPHEIDDIYFSSKTGSSFILHLARIYGFAANVEVSNPSIFAFHFNELEECRDFKFERQPGCTQPYSDSPCPNSYYVCSVKKGSCGDIYSDQYCSCYDNHNNETNLCGECIEGYSVAINSPYLECVPCNRKRDVVKGWVLLIVLEFVPLTIMIALIAILNVNLNQGSLKAYILFCQLFTIPFPESGYPFWVGLYNFTFRIRDFALLPFTIWNLGFISFPSCNLNNTEGEMINQCSNLSICISQNTTPLGAIAFWYVIAFYPFLLLAILYGYVIMYDKGYKCVVYTGRPVHRLLARFWQMFDIQPSLSHTIASVYVLCFTQLAATSLKLLDWVLVYTNDLEPRFFYDGSQRYFEKTHGAAFFVAWFVLIFFIFSPVSYLCIYPFKWFQKCFNKLKFKKDLLISVTDIFNGPYKNGTQDTWDYRYFAGIVFAIQLVQMIFSLFPSFFPTYFVQSWHIFISGLYVIFIILFRPYRRVIHSLTEVFAQLVLIGFSSFPILYEATEKKTCFGKDTVDGLWVACTWFLYFFLMVASIYCLVWITRKVKFAVNRWISYRAQQPLIDHVAIIEEDRVQAVQQPLVDHVAMEDDEHLEFPDRLMNPKNYDERHVVNEVSKLLFL